MLVHKNGGEDILGFICDMCTVFTSMDVIPNEHGEFRYICPKCGHHMKELPEDKKEENKMVNTYTVANAAKRLNCSTSTINRAIRDGRFHDCFTDAGYLGKPAWMIPSDQVEAWVTNGGFLHPGKKLETKPAEPEDKPRMVFDPEVKKEVPVLNLLGDSEVGKVANEISAEFMKRTVKRVAKNNKPVKLDILPAPKIYHKVWEPNFPQESRGEIISKVDANGKPIAGRYPWDGDTDGDEVGPIMDDQEVKRMVLEEFASRDVKPEPDPVSPASPVVRTDGGFSITIPTEMIEDIVHKQLKSEIAGTVSQLRTAFDLLNEELKKLEEAIA